MSLPGFDLGFSVTGLQHGGKQEAVKTGLREGDSLVFRRDAANAYDPNAIEILLADGTPIGWVPAKRDVTGNRAANKTNADLAARLDAGAQYRLECFNVGPIEEDPSKWFVYAVGRVMSLK